MKIYDCFVFFNEFDALKIRLSLYNDIVDKFVLCECSKTLRGVDKPYYFEQHKEEFSEWLDKIIYVKADNPPQLTNSDNDWSIEFYQRNCIADGLRNCSPDDLIFISDVDEFWNPEIVKNPKNFYVRHANYKKGKKIALKQYFEIAKNAPAKLFCKNFFSFLRKFPISIEQDFFYYFINYKKNEKWYGTVATLYKNFTTPQELRNKRQIMPFITSKSEVSGWHFSYLGGIEKIKEKLSSIIEGSLCKKENLDEWIKYCLENQKDLFERNNEELKVLTVEDIQFPLINEISDDYIYKGIN